MLKTKVSNPDGRMRWVGVSPYESPDCVVINISVHGPLCQSGLDDVQVDLGDKLYLGFGGDL